MSGNLPVAMQGFGTLAPRSNVLADSVVNPNAIAEGITPSFGIVTYRGKVWRIKYKGDEHSVLLPGQPGMPATAAPYIDVVIASASPTIAKIFYDGPYQEGDSDAPDCFSTNGVSPDPASPKKQAELCASCPKNMFGSRANTVTGAKGKACQDSKRLAVVPADDMNNEVFGGPMLLRVPPASLQGMGSYNSNLQNAGHTFFSVKTRLQFDPEAAYPKILFFPVAALSDGESQIVKALQVDARVTRMLNEAVDQVRDGGVGAAALAAQPRPAVVPTPAVAPAATPVPTPTVTAIAPSAPVSAPVSGVAFSTPVVAPADNADGLDIPGFLKPNGAAGAPVAPVTTAAPPPPAPVPPPAPTYTMAAGETHTREQYHAAGWTDDQLVAAGKLTIAGAIAPPPTPAPAGRGRGRRTATPSPSPAPTPVPTAIPQPAASVPAPTATAASPPDATATSSAPTQDAALAALDAKLAGVL